MNSMCIHHSLYRITQSLSEYHVYSGQAERKAWHRRLVARRTIHPDIPKHQVRTTRQCIKTVWPRTSLSSSLASQQDREPCDYLQGLCPASWRRKEWCPTRTSNHFRPELRSIVILAMWITVWTLLYLSGLASTKPATSRQQTSYSNNPNNGHVFQQHLQENIYRWTYYVFSSSKIL